MKNKQGLSAVVTTLIIILLVIVAAGIIWGVVNNFFKSGTTQIEISQKCLKVVVEAKAVACADVGGFWKCNVTYERSAGGDELAGMKIVLSNGVSSFTEDVTGDIDQIGPNTEKDIVTELANNVAEPNSVQLAPYFADASGNEQLCDPTAEFTF